MTRPTRPRSKRAERAELRTGTLALLLSFAAGCSPPGNGAPAGPAAAGPRVVLPSGAVLSVEVARTDQEVARGLMFRESMPAGAGMIFLFADEQVRPFWMKNCHFPLDMIFARKDGTVVDVLAHVPPCPADPCPSFPPKARSDTVVEVNAGVAAKNGVVPGARLSFREVPER